MYTTHERALRLLDQWRATPTHMRYVTSPLSEFGSWTAWEYSRLDPVSRRYKVADAPSLLELGLKLAEYPGVVRGDA